MNIRYIDTFSYKTAHLQFNASLLIMLSDTRLGVSYYAGRDSMAEVLKLLDENELHRQNVCTNKIFVYRGDNRFSLLMRYLISALMNLILLFRSSKEDILIYNFNNLFSLRLMNALNRVLKRKVLVCCHGELELLSNKDEGGPLAKCLRCLAKDFFLKRRKIQSNMYFMVLGDVILKNLRDYLSDTQLEKFISVDHPYVFRKRRGSDGEKSKLHEELNIGTVGVFSQAKGGDLFVEIVSKVTNPYVYFSITGRIFYPMEILKKLKVDTALDADKKALPQDIYNERIDRLDYILFLYDRNSYRITASGAVMDAINLRKPIIALENDYFCYLFGKYGSFGRLFKSIEDMIAFMSEQPCVQTMDMNSINFDKIQACMSPEYLAKDLHGKLKRIGFIS